MNTASRLYYVRPIDFP